MIVPLLLYVVLSYHRLRFFYALQSWRSVGLEKLALDAGVAALMVLNEYTNVCLWRYYVCAVSHRVSMVPYNFADVVKDGVEFF